ncbi:hypothetical protein PFICI_12667 [Pestalotiopsis fici W106-1]|uniref:Uncharacterized protein n=1 Tax=Pestalotiopsis fici (strain W106-1 / CGMCC3.15140) TaxID=1229662 RepID=W3WPF2_PESFW|nr:uncharacterized protein PFICI_12667 [Pestalotiopsis fici W106-1]ETS75723.1 hypothetical protein PFICI_12667 [Pestalotiopsis fici W106-1]
MSGYTRNEVIEAVRSFYTFLAGLPRLSADDILDPPEQGWPDLTDAYLAALGKTPVVCDLLRHLPYIRPNGQNNQQIAPWTTATNYTDSTTRWTLNRGLIDGNLAPIGAGDVPPHVAVLTSGSAITDFIQQERPERSEPAQDSPDAWRAYHTRPAEEFFEEWKDKYRTLEWAPLIENADDGVVISYDAGSEEVRQIYRDHGWPDRFDRAACADAIRRWEGNTSNYEL